MSTILFVCKANRFRSPLAAAYFSKKLAIHKDYAITASSAGTYTVDGLPATPEAQKEAEKLGLNLSSHKSRVVTKKIISEADLILVMEYHHKEAISQEFPISSGKIFILTEIAIGFPYDVPDPYRKGESSAGNARGIISIIDQGYEKIIQQVANLPHSKVNFFEKRLLEHVMAEKNYQKTNNQ